MMLFAFIVESFLKKTKRLKLVEVVFLLKEITNLEMDLRFEAAAANEYAENTKNDAGFKVPEIYWNFTSENVMTLDWIDGISIRESNKNWSASSNSSLKSGRCNKSRLSVASVASARRVATRRVARRGGAAGRVVRRSSRRVG